MSTEYLYWLSIMVIHPTLSLDEISIGLNIDPDHGQCVGEPRRELTGKLLGGVWPETRWWVSEVRNGERLFFTRLEKLLDQFAKRRDFLRMIAETGGETQFIIDLPGTANIGDTLSAQAVAKLADLKVSLGVEVVPRVNPREDKYIFADDP